jgi:hypothetical protein
MLAEAGQAVAEAAKNGSITIAVPTAFLSSVVTLIGREVLSAFVHKRKGRNGNGGPKPGAGDECLKHRDKITTLETKQETTDQLLGEVRDDVKEILRRVPKA